MAILRTICWTLLFISRGTCAPDDTTDYPRNSPATNLPLSERQTPTAESTTNDTTRKEMPHPVTSKQADQTRR